MSSYFSGMRHGYRILAAMLGIAFMVCLCGCQQDVVDDEDLIQQRLQQMAKAVEIRQVSGFLAGIHADFMGQRTLRKSNLAGLLLLHFRQHPSISVRLTDVDIQIDKDWATVTLKAHLSGQDGWLGRGRQLDIQSRWQKVDGDWQVERARWQELN